MLPTRQLQRRPFRLSMTSTTPSRLASSKATCATFGEMVVEESLKGLGVDHIDIMVSNAALLDVENYPPISELPFEQWSGMITSEAWAPLELARNAFKVMT